MSAVEMRDKIDLMTKFEGFSKRKAVAALARRHHLTPNYVYEVIERAKKLAK